MYTYIRQVHWQKELRGLCTIFTCTWMLAIVRSCHQLLYHTVMFAPEETQGRADATHCLRYFALCNQLHFDDTRYTTPHYLVKDSSLKECDENKYAFVLKSNLCFLFTFHLFLFSNVGVNIWTCLTQNYFSEIYTSSRINTLAF